MKYYGFKFKEFAAERSKINHEVGTWIGLVSTFLFMSTVSESGGFKGPMKIQLWYTIAYPAFLWFLNLLAYEHRWSKIAIIVLSGITTLFASVIIVLIYINHQTIILSVFLFMALNLGTFVLALKKTDLNITPKKN